MFAARAGMKVVASLVFVCVCGCGPKSLAPTPDGGGAGAISTAGDPGAPGTTGAGAGGGVSAGEARVCPVGTDVAGAAEPAPATVAAVPTQVPFSCAPLPEAFIFPPPASDVPGLYSRCGSYSVGQGTAVAMSPDGRFAALATGDGLLRVIGIGARRVVTVLARPRAMIDGAAFSADGLSILTLASAQREVALWRRSDATASPALVWTRTLPGHLYDRRFGGGIAFAPDGRSAVASPGTGVFVLDAATGDVRASAYAGAAVLDVAYGLGGRRVVVAVAATAGHCAHSPNGGVVALLDDGLGVVGTLADLGSYPGWHGLPAFRASPTEDLVLVAPSLDDAPGLRAFKLSDGTALPAPAFAMLPLPFAFMPDGASVLVNAAGALQRVRVADGSIVSTAMLGNTGPVAVSADGAAVVFAGTGGDLLRVWKTDDSAVSPVCATTAPVRGSQNASLSADGQLLALALGGNVRVVRRADGAVVKEFPANPATDYARIALSPRGEYLAIAPAWNANGGAIVERLADDATVASFMPDTSGWLDFLFPPAEDKVYSLGKRSADYSIDTVRFAAPADVANRIVPAFTTLLGFAGGCPVLYSGARGAWRSCGGCEETPIAAGPPEGTVFGGNNAVLSADGRTLAVAGAYNGPGVTLWSMPPDARALLSTGQRAEDAAWMPQEFPVAIGPGERMLTGAQPGNSCYEGPQFEVYVREQGNVLDRLPPGVTAVDTTVGTIAYGAQLWCAHQASTPL